MPISKNNLGGGFVCGVEESKESVAHVFKVVPLGNTEKMFPRSVSMCGTKVGVVSVDVAQEE